MSFLNNSSSNDVAVQRRAAGQSDQTAGVKDLENTIARFQAILTDDDRKSLQQLKTEPHDAQSIIMFTASLDRFDPKRRGKSVASRLASFLQTIEQFTPIVDTYIQSNPEIAALVWGSVKLTFKLLANFTSYFQSFVELLSGFGTLCSRFAEYQVIFKGSTRLKTSICEFHSSVVACCERLVLVTRRPMKSQAWMAITQSFQGELRTYVDDIKSKAEVVRDDIQLAKAQSDNEEHQLQNKARQKATENHSLISSMLKKTKTEMRAISTHGMREASEQRRRRLLKDLSSINYTSAFNDARNKRHLGTAEWVFKTKQFQNWITDKRPTFLHITGKIGSGKTILAWVHNGLIIAPLLTTTYSSSIVEHLCQIKKPNQFISFFFSRFDDTPTLDALTIIRSLIQQLLSACQMETMDPRLAPEITERLQSAQRDFFSFQSLQDLYVSAFKLTEDWFIILDGVDECESEQQRIVYDFLSLFRTKCEPPEGIKMLFSSRQTTIQSIDKLFNQVERLVTGTSNTSIDIVTFARDVIDAKRARGELVVRDERIISDILKTISSKEQGMFLWVFLTIEDICSGTNDKEIRRALREIPRDLPTTFDRALRRILKRRHEEMAGDIFGWTTAAFQPLTLTQLQEALSVKVGQRNLHPDDLINGIDRITSWCENLVCVEETDNKVHFSHHSIRDYLLKPKHGDLTNFHVDLKKFDHHVGEVCITYLNLENFKTALIESKEAEPPSAVTVSMEGLTEQTVRTAVGGSIGARIGRWTSRAVKSSTGSAQNSIGDAAIQSTLERLRLAPSSSGDIEYAFLEYAEGNWFRHGTHLDRNPDIAGNNMWALVVRLLRSSHDRESQPWNDLSWKDPTAQRQYSFLTLPDVYRPFIPSGSYFIPFQTQSMADIATDSSGDLSLIESLQFLVVYAVENSHESLACCAFMTLVERCPTSPVLKWLTLFLALEGKHSRCPNGCFSLLWRYLPHQELVEIVTMCIAAGLSHWPAAANGSESVVNTPSPCKCSKNRFQDFCKLITSGSSSKDHVRIQDFALVAMCRLTKATASHLPGMWMIGSLLNARTSNNMSIIDVAAEQHDWESFEFLDSFFDPSILAKAAEHTSELRKQALGGLCVTLRNGVNNAYLLVGKLATLLDSEGRDQFEHVDMVTLHLALCETVVFDWPSEITRTILSWYFKLSVADWDSTVAINNLIEKSVNADNWRFATTLVDTSSSLPGPLSLKNNDPFFMVALRALACESCRRKQTWPTRPNFATNGALLPVHQDYKLCSKHHIGSGVLRAKDPVLNELCGRLV